jgi:hypothetical protein
MEVKGLSLRSMDLNLNGNGRVQEFMVSEIKGAVVTDGKALYYNRLCPFGRDSGRSSVIGREVSVITI